uniref:AB hydrolase-1 domain-containing protein n=1 Tax=Aplanochytrium stocchinoi TaxID=215587 RepID=A0A7S3PPU5_9STRA|mmetsp:Transcript_3374/g.4550  ORF Transcript_3374/g.4550 Transcript_3374/m.4550 type:complete len:506 (+) Transcript_3374:129-1646(+)
MAEVELSGAAIALVVVLGLNVIYFTWKISGNVVNKSDKQYPSRIQIAAKLPSTTLSKLVEVSHGSTHYFYQGFEHEGTLIVCVHGDCGNYADFLHVASALGKRDRVLCFDLFGNGYSSCDGYARSKKLFACQIAELLFKLGEFEAIHLIGHGWGSTVAAYFAVLYPEKVVSLTLLSPGVYGKVNDDRRSFGVEEWDYPLLKNALSKEKKSSDNKMEKKSKLSLNCFNSSSCCRKTANSNSGSSSSDNESKSNQLLLPWINVKSERAVEYKQRLARCNRPEPALRRKVADIVYEPIKPELKIISRLEIPILVIWGTKELPRFASKLKALISDIKFAQVDGYCETFHIENPETTAEEINSFIEDCVMQQTDSEEEYDDVGIHVQKQVKYSYSYNSTAKLLSPRGRRSVSNESPRKRQSVSRKKALSLSPRKRQSVPLSEKRPEENHNNEITVEIPNNPAVLQLLSLPNQRKKHHAPSSSKTSRMKPVRELDHIAVHIANVPLTHESN